jgi:hypothetical protein
VLARTAPRTAETRPSLTLRLQVALIGPNHIDFIVATWAVLRLGGVILCVCICIPNSGLFAQPSGTNGPIPALQILHSLQFQNSWRT